MNKIYSEKVSKGDVIATLYSSDEAKLLTAKEFLKEAVSYTDTEPQCRNLIYKVI